MADPIMLLETENPSWKLEFSQLRAKEKLGRLFEYKVTALSPLPDIELKDLLGTKMSVVLTCHDESKRYFTGWAVRAGQTGVRGRMHEYTIILRPWLWFATKQRNTRIFQELKVDDILAKVFNHGIYQKRIHESESLNLTRSHEPRAYCVQYRESDFDFASRLMEEEGIYYWFDTDGSQVVFNLADNTTAHKPSPGTASLPYREHSGSSLNQEYVWEWRPYVEVPTQVAVLRDHNWRKPAAEKLEVTEVAPSTGLKDLELLEYYDYPEEYWDKDDPGNGPLRAQVHTDLEYAKWQRFGGKTNARNLRVGSLLQVTDHPRKDQNGKYVIVEAEYDLDFSGNESQGEDTWLPTYYECRFVAIKDNVTYASERITPKPIAPGPQCAVVVGEQNNIEPDGEDIFTDEYGRVMVMFKWDRRDGEEGDGSEGKGYGKDSSCWLRVSQPWAGNHYGAMFIPRIGNEVIVDFLSGNLDRPVITGRLYNPAQMPPDAMALPANKTKTWIRTRSSPGGNDQNYNELVFEDKKGHELVGIHAEKNMSTMVENDDSTSVGHDQSDTVGHNRSVHVKNDQTTTIDNDRTIAVKHDDKETVVNRQTINIGKKQILNIGDEGQAVQIVGPHSIILGNTSTVSVKEKYKTIAGAGMETHVTGTHDTLVQGDQEIGMTGNQTTSVQGKAKLSALTGIEFNSFADRKDISVGKHQVMATNLEVVTAAGISLMTTANIDQTSVGANSIVLGSNSDGYIGMASAANMGMNRETFMGLAMSNALGMDISNSLTMSISNSTLSLGFSVLNTQQDGIKFDLAALKTISPGAPGSAAATAAVVNGVLSGIAALAGIVMGAVDTASTLESYNEAVENLKKAAAEARENGLDGLADRLETAADIAEARHDQGVEMAVGGAMVVASAMPMVPGVVGAAGGALMADGVVGSVTTGSQADAFGKSAGENSAAGPVTLGPPVISPEAAEAPAGPDLSGAQGG